MKLSEAVVPVSYAKAHTAEVIADILETHRPVVITQNGRARVIVEDLRSYEQTQESLAMLKLIAQSRESVRRGRTKPFRKAFAAVRNRAHARTTS
ncbi:MAG: type II toxin-antitoxin system Phd/YefM family antitoxin [Kiritimatiellae bacterium]|nr:type II toxin-antitoxin system Phd/YefM family antitoxin [Kiritimatiellia bacterium]